VSVLPDVGEEFLLNEWQAAGSFVGFVNRTSLKRIENELKKMINPICDTCEGWAVNRQAAACRATRANFDDRCLIGPGFVFLADGPESTLNPMLGERRSELDDEPTFSAEVFSRHLPAPDRTTIAVEQDQ
jgi:hypothetical protein